MAKKVYVVWHGRQTGGLTDWEKCKDDIQGFPAAKYKAFKTTEAAQKALKKGFELYWGQEAKFDNELSPICDQKSATNYLYSLNQKPRT